MQIRAHPQTWALDVVIMNTWTQGAELASTHYTI
jgi:hypothetical protein